MSLANSLREAKGGACPPFLRSYEETLGLLARTWKDRWTETSFSPEGKRALLRAFSLYEESFRARPGAYWTGINAATLALLLKKTRLSYRLAGEVAAICERKLKTTTGEESYWLLATLGEAALVRGNVDVARGWYEETRHVAGHRWGDIASTRRNASLLADRWNIDWKEFQESFAVPPVVVFCGHMVDLPDRSQPRFPVSIAPRIKRAIAARLHSIAPGFAYSSPANGGDLLFLECALSGKLETHIVLPSSPEIIKKHCEAYPGTPSWASRFKRVIRQADSCTVTSEESYLDDLNLLEYSNQVLHGLALEKADRLGTRLVPMALWDGRPGDGMAGTATVVKFWRERGLKVEIINPLDFLDEPAVVSRADEKPKQRKSVGNKCGATQTKAILFADAVHFSRLQESQIPAFVREFLEIIGGLTRRAGKAIAFKNTWGDGFFFVFNNIRDAGLFAMDLAERINGTPWNRLGLPESLNLRIALHAGPVFPFLDPITGLQNFLGSHVNRAARMEPITPPGLVYTTQAFASLALAQGITEFRCEYVGRVPLAKSFGIFPLYHLRRAQVSA